MFNQNFTIKFFKIIFCLKKKKKLKYVKNYTKNV